MSNFFNFSVSLENGAMMTTVRLAVGGVAALAGLNVDESEDFKVCVTESLLLFKRNGFSLATCNCNVEKDVLTATLKADGEKVATENSGVEDEISFALLGALVDEVSFDKTTDGAVVGVTLIKKSV